MRNRLFYTLCTLALFSGSFATSVCADDLIVSDIVSDPELVAEIQAETAEHASETAGSKAGSASENASDSKNEDTSGSKTASASDSKAESTSDKDAGHTDAETESEDIALIETEAVYDVPLGISDGLEMNTPVGQAAEMSEDERKEFINEMCEANSAESFRGRHEDVTAVFSMYDDASSDWKQYSCSYTDYVLYYSDDWSPGMEELRLLIYGENDCMEHYIGSMGFVHFLNATDVPYRVPGKTPIVLSENTKEEMLLSLHKTSE